MCIRDRYGERPVLFKMKELWHYLIQSFDADEKIAKNAPIAVRNCKKAINEGLQVDMDQAIVIEELSLIHISEWGNPAEQTSVTVY